MQPSSQDEESSGQLIRDGISGQKLSSDENNAEYNLSNSCEHNVDAKRKNHRELKQGGQNNTASSEKTNNLRMKVANSDQEMEVQSEKMGRKKSNDFPKTIIRLIKKYIEDIEEKIGIKHRKMEQKQKILRKNLLSNIKNLLPEQSKLSARKRQNLDKNYLQKLLKPGKEVDETVYRKYVLQKIHSILSDSQFIQERLIQWKKILPQNVKKYLRLTKLMKIQCQGYHHCGTQWEIKWKGKSSLLGSLDVRFDQLQQIQVEAESIRSKNNDYKEAEQPQY